MIEALPARADAAGAGADDLDPFPEVLEPYLAYVGNPDNGYVSVELPIGDRLDLSVRTG